jgi:hypothetical protein
MKYLVIGAGGTGGSIGAFMTESLIIEALGGGENELQGGKKKKYEA